MLEMLEIIKKTFTKPKLGFITSKNFKKDGVRISIL
jgi:hypothetical protein